MRELEHAIERAVVFADGPVITEQDLTYFSVERIPSEELPVDGRLQTIEKQHIQRALELFAGHRAKTAQYLGIDRKTLRAKLAKYGISG